MDEKFEEKIEFCFDVYDHIIADLNSDLPEVGLDSYFSWQQIE